MRSLVPRAPPPDGRRLRSLEWDVEDELGYDATAPVVLESLEALWREARSAESEDLPSLPPLALGGDGRGRDPEPETPRAAPAAGETPWSVRWSSTSGKRKRVSDLTEASGAEEVRWRGAALPARPAARPRLDDDVAKYFCEALIDAAEEAFEKKRKKFMGRLKEIRRDRFESYVAAVTASGYAMEAADSVVGPGGVVVPRYANADPYYFDFNVLSICEAVNARAKNGDQRDAHARRVGAKVLLHVTGGAPVPGARAADALDALMRRFVDRGYADHATADATPDGVQVVLRAPATLVAWSVLQDGAGCLPDLHLKAALALLERRGAVVERATTDRRGDDLIHRLVLAAPAATPVSR